MKIQSLFGQFGSAVNSAKRLSIVVQPRALHFAESSNSKLPKQVAIEEGDWLKTLISTLKQAHVSNVVLDLVLNTNLYQTYQIDKPNVPQEELSLTLPFILKDLISEKVTDIVADATPLPMSNKLQAYVVSKQLILGLVQRLAGLDITLGQVLVEEELWGRVSTESERFILLQRSQGCHYKISAYVDNCCVFQRTIRGISSPLIGEGTSGLELDGIALELQRSIDYLSSQLRGANLHRMQVCCDDENNLELANALDERLSVKVTPFLTTHVISGAILSQALSTGVSTAVNLYPQHLKPKVERFTLNNIALVSLVVTLLLTAWFGYIELENRQLEQKLAIAQSQEKEFNQQLTTLNQRLVKHRPSPEKVAAVARLKEEISAKKDSLAAVSKYDGHQQAGYSGVMQSLAQLGRNDIALDSIQMDANNLDIRGMARDPQAIPNWVNQFKSQMNLVGRSFEKLKIARNKENILTFELRTKQEGAN